MVLSISMLFIRDSDTFSSRSTALFKSTTQYRITKENIHHIEKHKNSMAFLTRHSVWQFQFPGYAQTTINTPCTTTTDTYFWQKWLPLSLKTSLTNPWAWSTHEEVRSRYIYNSFSALGEPNTDAGSMEVPAPELCHAAELFYPTLEQLQQKDASVSTKRTNIYL